ncbi:MAG: metallophosphoesterase, partial [Clostridia bacterium]|nr:metallophosphoesterase [Clostridia bacterium]
KGVRTMKILVISDVESKLLLDHYEENHLEDIELILSAGDLSYSYLQDVKSNIKAPLYFVKGNHYEFKLKLFDREFIEWKCLEFKGIRIAGIGCCIHDEIVSEEEMEKLLDKLYKKIKKKNGVDIVVSHFPLMDYGDGSDGTHKGYSAIKDFIIKIKPKYFIYGHNHLNYGRNERIEYLEDTILINAYEKYVFDYNF